jgi:DNA-binding CsgD family transcriptional regulator
MDEIAIGLNISTKTLYNYLNFLRSKELICDHAKNLKLRSIRDFKTNRKKSVLLIRKHHNLFDVTCLLYSKLIEQKAKQQVFSESVRRFGRGDRFKSGLCENPFRPSLSYRTIAKLLFISESKAFRVIENLNRMDVIKTTKQKPKMIKEDVAGLKFYIEDYPGYRFEIGNKLFELFGCKHDFIQFPVYLKNINIRQYKKQISRNL